MMSTRKAIFGGIILLLLLAFTIPTASQQGDNITVNGADEIITTSVSISQDLEDSLANVGPRVVLQYANHLRRIELPAVPNALQTLLDQLSARVVVEYANAIYRKDLPALPGEFQTLLGQVSERVVFQYANANRQESLVYPQALFNDTTPPQISDVSASLISTDSAVITWTTDEFATSTVLYGTQSGNYTWTVSDPLYAKQHEVVLSGITPGATYYYKVRSTDRSGNTATSSEYSFTAKLYVYLPLIVKR